MSDSKDKTKKKPTAKSTAKKGGETKAASAKKPAAKPAAKKSAAKSASSKTAAKAAPKSDAKKAESSHSVVDSIASAAQQIHIPDLHDVQDAFKKIEKENPILKNVWVKMGIGAAAALALFFVATLFMGDGSGEVYRCGKSTELEFHSDGTLIQRTRIGNKRGLDPIEVELNYTMTDKQIVLTGESGEGAAVSIRRNPNGSFRYLGALCRKQK